MRLTREQVEALQPGMSRQQVKEEMREQEGDVLAVIS